MATPISPIITSLKKKYPNATYELNWNNPFELLVATILAAQCTDERVNQTTPGLFARFPDAKSLANADLAELEELVRPTGFFRKKAKAIKEMSQALVDDFAGEVPNDMADMITLPGVARKTANVVLNVAFKNPSGIMVDTHVQRVSKRLGLSKHNKADQIEKDLMELVPQKEWITFGPALVLHGRYTCTAKDPKCGDCILAEYCPKIGV